MREKIGINLVSAHVLFIIIAVLFGMVFIKLTPPLWGLDETSHFARVYQLAHGDILPNVSQKNFGGNIPDNLITLDDYVKSDLLDNNNKGVINRQDVDSRGIYQRLTNQSFSPKSHNYIWTAVYSPFAYIGPVLGVFIADLFNASIGQTIILARITSLFLYIFIVWLSLKTLKGSKLRWLVFAIALLPVSLFQASVVTADNITIALSLLFVSLLIVMFTQESDSRNYRVLTGLIVVGLLLPLIKLNYVFLSLAIVLLPAKVFMREKGEFIKYGSILIVTITGFIWSSIIKASASGPVSQRPDGLRVVPGAQLSFVSHHPLYFLEACLRTIATSMDSYLQSGTGLIGWNYVPIPYVFILLLCVGILIAGLNSKNELLDFRRQLLALGGIVIIGILGVFGALYVAFNPVGRSVIDGVQGRYFIPFALPAIIAVMPFLPIDIRIKEKSAPYLFSSISGVCLVVSVIFYYLMTY